MPLALNIFVGDAAAPTYQRPLGVRGDLVICTLYHLKEGAANCSAICRALLITFPRASSRCSSRRDEPELVGANCSSHQGFAYSGGISSPQVSVSLGLHVNGPLCVHAIASGFNFVLQCFMWPKCVVHLYEGYPYGWPAWVCVTSVHQQGSCAA